MPHLYSDDDLHALARAALDQMDATLLAPDRDEAGQRFAARLDRGDAPESMPTRDSAATLRARRMPDTHRTSIMWRRLAWIGGGVAVVAAALVAVRSIQTRDGTAIVVSQDYSTRRAQQARVQLPDGSRVVLAPETQLRYIETRGGRRMLTLTGEAYFTVAHDAARPLVVQAGGVDARVLGTSFAVRAYPTDRVTRVAVAEGKVAIGSGLTSVVLLPGDVGRASAWVSAGDAPIVTHDARISDVFGWMRGQLAFGNAPFRDVAAELERTYDLTIRFADSTLANRPVTAMFGDGSAAAMLDAITIAADVRYERRGQTVVIFSK